MPVNESIKENYLVHKNPMPLGVGVSDLEAKIIYLNG